jgi:hypothetical protein
MPRPGGRALCAAHSTVALDTVPPDPLQSVPVQAADTFCSTPCILSSGHVGAHMNAMGREWPREALPPADGMERC